MRRISEFAGEELVWVEPALLKEPYMLLAGDEVVGSLHWESPTLAKGETADQRWTFQQKGFWRQHVTIRVPGSDDNVALFHSSWWGGGGILDLNDGHLRFHAGNWWSSQWDWEWLDSDKKPLVHFKGHHGLIKTKGQIKLEAHETSSPDLPLLVVLGWYLLIMIVRDDDHVARRAP